MHHEAYPIAPANRCAIPCTLTKFARAKIIAITLRYFARADTLRPSLGKMLCLTDHRSLITYHLP
jgi:hypothetical protein